MLDNADNLHVCINSKANSRILDNADNLQVCSNSNLEAQKTVPYLVDMWLFNNSLSNSNGRMTDE